MTFKIQKLAKQWAVGFIMGVNAHFAAAVMVFPLNAPLIFLAIWWRPYYFDCGAYEQMRITKLIPKEQSVHYELNHNTRELIGSNGQVCKLGIKEYLVLQRLTETPGQLVTTNDLLEMGWKHSADAPLEYVSKTISDLRKKLGDTESVKRFIDTAHLGYVLIAGCEHRDENPRSSATPSNHGTARKSRSGQPREDLELGLATFKARFEAADLSDYFDLLLDGEDVIVKASGQERYESFHAFTATIGLAQVNAMKAEEAGDTAAEEASRLDAKGLLEYLKKRIAGIHLLGSWYDLESTLTTFKTRFQAADLSDYFDLLLEGEDVIVKASGQERYDSFQAFTSTIGLAQVNAMKAGKAGDSAAEEASRLYAKDAKGLLEYLKKRIAGMTVP
jgi:DNA-binding winged helix-turn-helix (wHTH) protein